ncbi:hypothetical protein CK203_038014 [Vitis vinifera]|uniref:Uncharacterized protein n=1 Tax=Vitis vinifera TaxID=29760 RepID=A0A438HNV4_VITVI|nr:hypothetical protein CK203_038014 [Vitis vinifera]
MLSQTVVYSVENCLPRPITMLSFIGKSEYLVSASRGSKSQLSLWSLSKLSESWSYKLQAEAVACVMDGSYFAVLTLLPRSSKHTELTETKIDGRDGAILLFNVGEPIPVTTWNSITAGLLEAQKPVWPGLLKVVGKFGYASIYGALPEFDAKRNQTELAPLLPSEKPWETIFCGSSHNLPPITKLCSAFLESLLEKRTPVISD